MFIQKLSLPRRTMLKGLGATLALPLLEAMVPALTATAKTAANPRLRFGAIYVPHGEIMDQWTPASQGPDFAFTPILKAVESHRDRLLVVSNLFRGGDNNHAVTAAAWLSGAVAKPTEAEDVRLGTTIDQVIAKHVGQDTPFPSIELATEDFAGYVGGCSPGYSCAYMNTISWATPTTPLPMEIDPRVAFERMFGQAGSGAQRRVRMERSRSILDAITEDAKKLQRGLGPRDRVRVSEYLDDIREIERRIQATERQNTTQLLSIDAPIGVPESYDEHVSVMFDMLAVAYAADLTRVSSFMLARELSNLTYPQIGVGEPHHSISHHGNNPEKIALHAKVNTHHLQLFSAFAEKLKTTPDGDGCLLDHSLLFYGSGMSNGNGHTAGPLPMLVVGGTGAGGRHVELPMNTPLGNFWVDVASKFDVPLERFGDSTGRTAL
jgi:hypothetical protein